MIEVSRMKYIFFVNRFSLNQDFVIKQDFESLESEGFTVRYLDLSVAFKKAKQEDVIPDNLQKWNVPLSGKKALTVYLQNYASEALLVSFVQYIPNSAWMYAALFKSAMPYIIAQNPNPPRLKKENLSLRSFRAKLDKLSQRFYPSKLYEKPVQQVEFVLSKMHRRPAIVASSYTPKVNKSMALLCDDSTRLVYSSSVDYRAAMNTNNSPEIEGDYAVFVDQFFCHHTDFLTNHIVHYFSADQYYPLLNRFLDDFSKKHKLKMVIAGHPRRVGVYEDDFNFPIYLNKTPDLVRHAKVVLVHFSTAISFSVIFKRPICFLDAAMFDRSTVRTELERFSNYFEHKPQRIELPVEGEDSWTNPDSEHYNNYLIRFLKNPGSEDITLRDLLVEYGSNVKKKNEEF